MNLISVDFESFYSSECSVSELGPLGYFSHPLFDAYLVSIASADGATDYSGPVADAPWGALEGAHVVSHNDAFDEALYHYGTTRGWWPKHTPAVWSCTADMCAYLGLPRSLAGAVNRVWPDEAATKSTRDAMKGRRWENMSPEFQAEVIEYARKDAKFCLRLWQEFSDKWPEWEREISRANRRIMERGIPVNATKILESIEHLAKLLHEAESNIPWASSAKLLSRPAFNSACREHGLEPPKSLAMDDPEADAFMEKHGSTYLWLGAVRNWRRINALKKKLESFDAATMPDGRYYGGLLYFGAHTGRFSGSGGNLNLQNLPQGDLFGVNLRHMIEAAPGRTFLSVDLSQIEVRTLAWLAGDHETLDTIRDSLDIYEGMAIRLGLWSPEKGNLKKNSPETRRAVKGIVLGCIAEGTLVLTDRGEIPIEKVTPSHRVWDGQNFVSHRGLIYRGEQEVITFEGVRATPDHRLLTNTGWVPIREAASPLVRPIRASENGSPVRVMDCSNPHIRKSERLPFHKMPLQMRDRETDVVGQPAERPDEPMRALRQPIKPPALPHAEAGCSPATLSESKLRTVQRLRRAGDHFSLAHRRECGGLGAGQLGGARAPEAGIRPDQQRLRLPAGKLTMGHPETANGKLKTAQGFSQIPREEKADPTGCAGRSKKDWDAPEHPEFPCPTLQMDTRTVVRASEATERAKVYDIAHAGPLNRFTAGGYLVENCGFGMGSERYAETAGVSLEEAEKSVALYRERMTMVVDLWGTYKNAIRHAWQTGQRLRFRIPPGRIIDYGHVTRADQPDRYGRPQYLVMMQRKGSKLTPIRIHQGVIVENMAQALARNIFCDALLRLEAAGFQTILHIHDEVLIDISEAEAETALPRVVEIMSTAPSWLPEIPLAAEGSVTRVYTK